MRALLAIVPLVLAAGLASAQDGASVLARLESSDEEVRDAAEDEWDELDEATQVRLARAALADPDAPGALASASRVSPWCLDLDEMSRQARAFFRYSGLPVEWRHAADSFGAREIPEAWLAPGVPAHWLEPLHRVATEASLTQLLDQRDDVPDERWVQLLWTVRLVAWHTDAERERVAALLADDLARWPDLDVPVPAREGSGLPPHFETIARCAWGLERYADRGRVLSRVVPWAWLLRWATDVTPTSADLEFLDDVVRGADDDSEARVWALRHRVRLSGVDAVPWLTSLLGDEGPDCEPEIAAQLALLGERDAWDALQSRDPAALAASPALWVIDRVAAVAAAFEEVDLSVEGRAYLRMIWGIEVGAAELASVAGELAARDDALAEVVAFYAREFPEGVRGPAAGALARRLEQLDSGEDAPDSDDLLIVLGLLEVRARDDLVRVLRAWCDADAWLRELAVNALMELGEDVERDLAWTTWTQRGLHIAWEDVSSIGLHPDDEISGSLRMLAASDDERAADAFAALARSVGLSRDAAYWLGMFVGDVEEDTRAAVLPALGSERPTDAVRLLFEATGESALVAYLDPAHLRGLRDRRENELYWHATLALALSGDTGACAEIERLLDENRTPIIDTLPLDDPRYGRRFARRHAQRLAHNCCSRYQSVQALRAAYPTLPVWDAWTLATQREFAVEWLDAHERGAVFSKIANGWVPR